MKKVFLSLTIVLFVFSSNVFAMDQASMEKSVKDMAEMSSGGKGMVEFVYKDVKMYVVSDVDHDRMRIIAPIIKYDKLSRKQLDAILESNFHKSLDARYAVSKGVLYSAYIHPLSELNLAQVQSAVIQAANLAISFGNEYSSGVLTFGKK